MKTQLSPKSSKTERNKERERNPSDYWVINFFIILIKKKNKETHLLSELSKFGGGV